MRAGFLLNDIPVAECAFARDEYATADFAGRVAVLIAAVAEKAGLTKKDVEKTITATLETVKEVVAKGDKVQVVGFGTFEARARKEREGKNPQNGEKVVIPAATIPAFKAGKAFKDAVNVK